MKQANSSSGKKGETYQPLLDDTADGSIASDRIIDDDKPKLFNKNPYEDSIFLSKLFFSWVTPLARVSHIFQLIEYSI